LDTASEDMLLALPEGLLQDVVDSFDPPPDTRNMNAKLKTFVRSKSDKPRSHAAQVPSAGSRPGAASTETLIRQFAEQWGIDDKSVEMLRQLPPQVCARVFEDFSPPPDTQNISAKLSAFVRGRMNQSGPQPQFVDPISQFVMYWGADAASEALLRSLAPEHLEAVLQEFDPKEGTQNLSGKLTSYVRSVCSRTGKGKGKASQAFPSSGAHGHQRQAFNQPLQERRARMPETGWVDQDQMPGFTAHWGLDGQAEQALRQLPFAMQERVIAEFNPPPGTVNASGKLTAFIRTKMREDGGSGSGGGGMRRQHADPVAEFAGHWRLDAEADQLFRSLPWDAQEGVMRDFNPRSDTQNCSAKLQSFIRTRLGQGAFGSEADSRGKGKPPLANPRPRLSDATGGLGKRKAHSDGDPIGDFVQKWGLDERSESMVRSLPEEVSDSVLANFEPQAGTRNPNAKLATWVRSLQQAGPSTKRPRQWLEP